MKALLTCLNAFGFVVFGIFAYVQFNDTDPAVYHEPSARDAWMWLIFYAFIALLYLIAVFRSVPRVALIIAVVFCMVLMVLTGPGFYENAAGEEEFTLTGSSMAPSRSYVELSREFLGATICLVAVVLLWCQRRANGS